MTVQDEIVRMRKRKGLSRIDFAKHFGIPYRTIQEWELGRRHPPQWVIGLLERVVEEDFPNNLNTIHKISNITFDKVMFRTIRESDGKVCETHELIADRTYEDGTVDKQVTCIVNQREYEEIQKYGYYNVYDELEENNK